MLIDTHCHIHEADYPLDIAETLKHAHAQGVEQLICIGTSEESSRQAIAFASKHDEAYASVGVHPHDTKDGYQGIESLVRSPKVVAVGEIGLDYFYTHSPREMQIRAFEWQIELALRNNLPIIFHVREAFDDFWPIVDNFTGIRGVLHSFTDNQANLDKALERGLYVGVNGISTFTRDEMQKVVFASIPLNRLLLETDAPFLTPSPFRGRVNEPAFVKNIAEYHALMRNISFEEVATATTTNARAVFAL
ncbi:TatD family hydrolase [Candidatus Saccharibacteria bacterium]|nr:TatD family hydrolase [Candidatus Saccharibacteria bacterium]